MLIEQVLIPLLSAIVGGVLGALVTLAGIRYVEWFRRLARWEPYAQSLWSIQVEVMRSVVQQTTLVYMAVLNCVRTASDHEKFLHYLRELSNVVEPLMFGAERLVLLNVDFNKAVTDFSVEALKAIYAPTNDVLPNDYSEKLWAMRELIMEMARKELGVSALHSRTSDAVQDARQYQDLLTAFEAAKPQSPTPTEDEPSSQSKPSPLA